MGSNPPDGEGPCPRLTTLAEAEHESENDCQLRVYPYCPRHLYIGFPDPTPEELELEKWCVTNFVVQQFGGQGTAEVLGECPVDNIPGPYEPCEDEEDLAWYVTYRDEQGGQERRGVAVYLTWENWWEWFPVKSS
jgi:hypothetical protein